MPLLNYGYVLIQSKLSSEPTHNHVPATRPASLTGAAGFLTLNSATGVLMPVLRHCQFHARLDLQIFGDAPQNGGEIVRGGIAVATQHPVKRFFPQAGLPR